MNKKKKPAVTLPGIVEKIIPTKYSSEPEKAEIAVDGADLLYKEIRIENTLQGEEGKEVSLKPGAQVDVTIEAEPESTRPKKTGTVAIRWSGGGSPKQVTATSRVNKFTVVPALCFVPAFGSSWLSPPVLEHVSEMFFFEKAWQSW
jgi:hypothetical protein